MQFFIDFHQGPPRTIWQGHRRPVHKWPLLKSTPAFWPLYLTNLYNMSVGNATVVAAVAEYSAIIVVSQKSTLTWHAITLKYII